MNDERPELEETSWLSGPLRRLTALVIAYPKRTVGIAVATSILALLIAAGGLKFKTSRLDLLSPRSEYNQRWLAYLEEFGDKDDAVVVVQGDSEGEVVAAIDSLAADFTQSGRPFEFVLSKWDLSTFRAKAMHFFPPEQLAQLEQQLRDMRPLMSGANRTQDPTRALAALNDRLEQTQQFSPEQMKLAAGQYGQAFQELGATAGSSSSAHSTAGQASSGTQARQTTPNFEEALAQFQSRHLLVNEGRMGFVLLRLKSKHGEGSPGADAIRELRGLIADAKSRDAGVQIGLTGMPILEFDEMTSSQNDMSRATWLSFAMVGLLFWACFGSWKHTLLANAALMVGMCWSLGYLTLVVGHLNILSVAFAAILVGIGIDFGIHYIAHYLRFRAHGLASGEALIATAGDVGPGMVTSGLTTALAFCTAALTEFVGIAELGIIAGGGIMLCVVAAATVLPAMIHWCDRHETAREAPVILHVSKWSLPARWFPKLTLAATVVVTLVIGLGAFNIRYDHNLLNLQANHLESVEIEREVLAKGNQSFWCALTMADDPAQARELKAKFEQLDTVAHVEEVASLLPVADPDARGRIVRISAMLDKLPTRVPDISPNAIKDLDSEVARAERLWRIIDRQHPIAIAATGIRQKLASTESPSMAALAKSLPQLRSLRAMCDPEAPRASDLAPSVAARFIGQNGRHLLRIHAKGDIWDMEALQRFVADVESIDPHVTGHPVQTFYASRHMQRSYLQAAMYSLIAVAAVIMLDFQSIRLTLLAMSPLVLGVVQMIGFMGWFNIPFNPANMIALPLILGMGVEDGVHLVHEFRRMKHRFWLTDSTAMAVMLTSSTTMASFACLIVSRHQGLRTLGQVLTVGVFTCLGVALLGLVALLRMMTRELPEEAGVGEAKPQAIDAPVVAATNISTPVMPAPTQPRRVRPSLIDLLGDDEKRAA